MKTFVRYVIQNLKGHKYESTVVTSQNPPYSFTSGLLVSDVMEWTNEKKEALKEEEESIAVSMYRL